MTTDAATLARRALDPRRSVVVAACAGSGKTWLLVSRILRLLLAGVAPGEILAITFTRYAAQEMASRLREWLQLLATAGESEVHSFLRARCVPESELLGAVERGRGLYEEVLRAQPALTISTFHSWYIQLLRRAPLSAGALGNVGLSEHTSALIEEAWELFGEACRREPQGDAATGLDFLLRHYGRHNTRALLTSFLDHRADWWAYAGSGEQAPAAASSALRRTLGVDPGADLKADMFAGPALRGATSAFVALLAANSPSDKRTAAVLGAALAGDDAETAYRALRDALFTRGAKPERRKREPSKAQQARLGASGEAQLLRLHDELCARIEALAAALGDQHGYRVNAAAFAAGVGLIECYQRLKRDRLVVDFADVEWLACDLLTQHEQAITLQFKLDSRYRHILLDEFQDTNPLQWLALQAWFNASAEAGTSPEVFLVGDPKQAIYRFRRADAKLFDAARRWLVTHRNADTLTQDRSRRCAPALLEVVNRVFADEPLLAGDFAVHVPHDSANPGRVEIMPLAVNASDDGAIVADDLGGLRDPLATPLVEVQDTRRACEATQLVARLRTMIGHWEIGSGSARRPARYSDVMILVRARTHLPIYERALRQAAMPFVTSRRGGLLETLEIQDVVALLDFLVLPFDDLQLAHVLRSPLFGCSDADLIAVARTAGATWWGRLQHCAEATELSALGRARRLLSTWLERADRLPVHDQLDKIYFEGDIERRYAAAVPAAMRAAVLANLHAFIERALALDAGRYPSLPRFLDELRELGRAPADEAPDEGGIDTGGNAMRILTVHGAKGLEAPIVWVLDAASPRQSHDSYRALIDWAPGAPKPAAFSLCTVQSEHTGPQRAQLEEERRRDEREDLNLLYVAMTRAQQVLIVSGSASSRGGTASWYHRARVAAAACAGIHDDDVLTPLAHGVDLAAAAGLAVESAPSEPPVPFVPTSIPTGQRREVGTSAGQRYGTAFHRVMEVLADAPRADADAIARSFGLDPVAARRCVEQARALLGAPALRRFFMANEYLRACNEVPLIDAAGGLRRIDRVVEFTDEVWVLDYKTGQHDVPEESALQDEYRAQVAEYCRSLRLVYPGRPVRGALVFADGSFVDVTP